MDPHIRVLLADDHAVFRKEVRRLLEEAPDIRVVVDVENGELAMSGAQEHEIDVAILDLDMPLKDGLDVARHIQSLGRPIKVVLLTVHKSQALVNKALEAGVSGYVLKDDAFTELLECVRAVHASRHYFSAQLSTFLHRNTTAPKNT